MQVKQAKFINTVYAVRATIKFLISRPHAFLGHNSQLSISRSDAIADLHVDLLLSEVQNS